MSLIFFVCQLSLSHIVEITPKSPWLTSVKVYYLWYILAVGWLWHFSTFPPSEFQTPNRDMLLSGIKKSTVLATAMVLDASATE